MFEEINKSKNIINKFINAIKVKFIKAPFCKKKSLINLQKDNKCSRFSHDAPV